MPYSGANDPKLPANVKKMPVGKRKQWISVFNSAMSKNSDESKAFAMANGVAKKTKSFSEDVYSTYEVERRLVSQQAAQYDPFGASDGEGCAACQWFISPNSCMLVQGDISPSGISKFFTAAADLTDEPTPFPVYIVSDPDAAEDASDPMDAGMMDKAKLDAAAEKKLSSSDYAYVDSEGGKHLPINDAAHVRNALARFNQTHFESDSAKSSALTKIHAAAKKFGVDDSSKSVFKSTFDWFMNKLTRDSKELSPFFVVKSADGQWRVFLVYSNSFKDNTNETIVEAAHKEYVDWATTNNVYPELQLWHAGPGSKWGQVDFLAYSNGFAISSGLVDKGKENIAAALEVQAKQGNLRVSHGYWGLKSLQGDYLLYRDFEQSPLPAKAEANSWTGIGFDVLAAKESDMVFDPAKRQWLKEVAGMDDAGVDKWEASLKQAEASLANAGVARKEVGAASAGVGVGDGAAAGATGADPLLQVAQQMKEIGANLGNVLTVVQANKADVDSKIETLATAVQTIAKEVKKSQDDIVAEAYKSNAARTAGGYVASEQAGATVATAAVKEAAGNANDWFNSVVLGDFKNVGNEAASTSQAAAAVTTGVGGGV